MYHQHQIRRLSILAAGLLALLTVPACGQIIYGQPASGGFQFIYTSWTATDSAGNEAKVSQMIYPIDGFVPLDENLEARILIPGASSTAKYSGSEKSLSGLGDVRLQVSQSLSNDQVLWSLGFNLPTGKKELSLSDEYPVIAFLSQNYLNFPLRRLGEGLGVNAMIGAASFTGNTKFGVSAMYQYAGSYTAYEDGGDYDPGDQINLNAGMDAGSGGKTISTGIMFTTFTDDKLDGGKIFKQGSLVDLRLGGGLRKESYTASAEVHYLVRSRNTRYDSTEAIYDQLKIYGNEFALSASVGFQAQNGWSLGPIAELRFIAGNEYGFESSNILGLGGSVSKNIGKMFDIGGGARYFFGSADGGNVDLSGFQITAGLSAKL